MKAEARWITEKTYLDQPVGQCPVKVCGSNDTYWSGRYHAKVCRRCGEIFMSVGVYPDWKQYTMEDYMELVLAVEKLKGGESGTITS